MTENAKEKKARVTERHPLPKEYDGRCSKGEYFSTYLTVGGTLKEGLPLHKYEIRLPIPKNDKECREFYDLPLEDIIRRGIAKLATDVDDTVKATLFNGIEKGQVAEVSKKVHIAGQQVADNWRYTPRQATGKTASVSDIVGMLKASGKIAPDANVENKAELMKLLASLK